MWVIWSNVEAVYAFIQWLWFRPSYYRVLSDTTEFVQKADYKLGQILFQ